MSAYEYIFRYKKSSEKVPLSSAFSQLLMIFLVASMFNGSMEYEILISVSKLSPSIEESVW